MIHDIFHLDLPVAEKVLRVGLIYLFVVGALRLSGKRQLAQLSTIDVVVLLAVANAVQNGIQGNDNLVTGNVISAVTLFVLNAAVAWLVYHSGRARRVIEGTGTVLIENGEVLVDNCHRQEISLDDLLVAVQRQGADGIEAVERAVLEPGGAIVITHRGASREGEAIAALDAKVDNLAEAVAALAARLAPSPPASS